MLRHTTLCATVVVMMAMGGTYAQRRSGACDGLEGNAWGLCNAYCYAKNCYIDENKNSRSCTQIYYNFKEVAPAGTDMPCGGPISPESQLGSCPCNFDLQFWTDQPQILPTSLSMCGTEPCIICKISEISGSTTFLSVLVNLLDGDSSQEDKLFFFTTAPSSLAEGTCFSDGSFNSGAPITTEGGQLPVTSEQFSACVSDIGALQSAYVAMCQQ